MASARCDECTEAAKAVWACDTCSCHFCDDCHAHHKRSKKSSQHSTRPLSTTPAERSTSLPSAPSPEVNPGAKAAMPSQALYALGPGGDQMALDMSAAADGSKDDSPGKMKTKAFLWVVQLMRAPRPGEQPLKAETPKKSSMLAKVMGSGKKGQALAAATEEQPGWLGVDMKNRTDGHIVITGINPQGPAADKMCILPGDILISVGGTQVRNMSPQDLANLTRGAAGTMIEIVLGLQFVPGESYIGYHYLAQGEKVLVDRVQRSAEGLPPKKHEKKDDGECKAVEISMGNKAQVSDFDLSAMSKCFIVDLNTNAGSNVKPPLKTPPAPSGSPTKFSSLSPTMVKYNGGGQVRCDAPSDNSLSGDSDTDTPRSMQSLSDRNLTPIQVKHLKDAQDYVNRNSPIAMA